MAVPSTVERLTVTSLSMKPSSTTHTFRVPTTSLTVYPSSSKNAVTTINMIKGHEIRTPQV